MDSKTICDHVNQLAESVILAEVDDPAGLAELHTLYEELINKVTGDATPLLPVSILTRSVEMIEQLILNDTQNAQQDLDDLGQTIGVLQALCCGELSIDEVDFPASLHWTAVKVAAPVAMEDEISDAQALTVDLPPNVDESILSDFLSRQPGELEKLECQIMELEKDNASSALGEIKRMIHTLKGETGLLGLTPICDLCHAIEDAIANRAVSELIEPMLKIKDWLERIFGAYAGQNDPPQPVASMLALLHTTEVQEVQQAPQVIATQSSVPQAKVSKPIEEPENKDPQSFADPTLVAEFITESREHLDAAEAELLNLEENPEDEDKLNAIFRSFHTIKGVAGFIGLPDIQSLAHISETVLDRARKHTLVLSGHPLDVAFDAVDAMKRLIDRLQEALEAGGVPQPDPDLHIVLDQLNVLANPDLAPADAQEQTPTTSVSASIDTIESDESDQDDESESSQVNPNAKIGQILQTQGQIPAEKINQALTIQHNLRQQVPKIGEVLTKMCGVEKEKVDKALQTQQQTKARAAEAPAQSKSVQVAETVKVDAPRLDRLVDAIGELVIAQAMLGQAAMKSMSGDAAVVARNLSHLDKITRELQEMATSLRMIPVRSTFQKMARLARDVARKLDKQVNFVMEGEDTELDKTVVDRIGDPLVHMVRNALDHGLEPSGDERKNGGKDPVGTVTLKAYHKGGGICIEIQDDGRGLDEQVLLNKAIERGVIQEGDQLSQQEIFQLIFAPGFSTAKQVTDVSGRGVGMDVVKRNIEALRGKIEIQSEKGKGSTFTIRLPLTLAIIEGMVVRLSTERYIIPTLSIVRMLQPGEIHIKSIMQNGQALLIDNELIPLARLDRLFEVPGAVQDPTQATVVIVENSERKMAILTDELIGQQQIVIKSLGATMRGLPGIAGGAIMSDGRVGLVVDISGLMTLFRTTSNAPAKDLAVNIADAKVPEVPTQLAA
jgi:two-component system chemotaxis sensor kinase CheA